MKRTDLDEMRRQCLEAEKLTGVKVLLGVEANFISNDGTIDLNDESVAKYNLERGVKLLGMNLNISSETIKNMAYVRAFTSLGSAVLDLVLLVTGPVGALGSLLKSFAVQTVMSVVLEGALSFLLSAVIPGLAAMLAEDLVSDVLGMPYRRQLIFIWQRIIRAAVARLVIRRQFWRINVRRR